MSTETQKSDHQTFHVPYEYYKLDNGLRVVLSPDHLVPVVANVVLYDVGARNEQPGRTGFAHLFEHMMFQGSENVPKGEFFKCVEDNGGLMNGMTSNDFTIYYEVMPGNQMELALWLEADRMRALQVDQDNLDNQRDVVKEEKRLRYDNQPYVYAIYELLMDKLFKNFANAHTVIGSMDDLNAATLDDVQSFWRTYYAVNNAIVVLAGDFDVEEAKLMIEKHFGGMKPEVRPANPDFSEPERAEPECMDYTDPLAAVPVLASAVIVCDALSDDAPALTLLERLLLEGENARLHQRLVKNDQSCASIGGGYDMRRGPGCFQFIAMLNPGAEFGNVLEAIQQELQLIAQHGVKPEELVRMKTAAMAQRFNNGFAGTGGLQTPQGRAFELGLHTLIADDPGLINTDIDRLYGVTSEQIQAVASRYFQPAKYVTVNVLPGAGMADSAEEDENDR